MRVYGFFLVCAGALVIALGVWAGIAPSRAGDEGTRIVIDQDANVVRFVIDGEVVAVLDATALHVRGDINFGGSLTDYGGVGFDMQTGGERGNED